MPRSNPITPRISALDEFDESVNLLVYAENGAGKTVLAGSMDEQMLILATENGVISARRMGSRAKVWRVESWNELVDALNWIKAELRRTGGKHIEFQGTKITWLALDTATEMQELCRRGILDSAKAQNAARDEDVMQLQDHMKWQNMFKRFIKTFVDMPINVLWLAASIQEENEDGDKVVRPAFSGRNGTPDPSAMSKWVTSAVSAYAFLTVRIDPRTKQEYRRLIFRRPFGKDRYNITEGKGYIDNPTLPVIEDRITAIPTPAPRRRRSANTAESE